MRLPSLGSHVTSGNRGSFVKQEREHWERSWFCETCRSHLSSILKINLILLLWHYKELQTCTFMARLIRCMQKQTFNRRVLLSFAHQFRTIFRTPYFTPYILKLIACLYGKCAIIYVFCRSPNGHMKGKNALTPIMYTLCQMDALPR